MEPGRFFLWVSPSNAIEDYPKKPLVHPGNSHIILPKHLTHPSLGQFCEVLSAAIEDISSRPSSPSLDVQHLFTIRVSNPTFQVLESITDKVQQLSRTSRSITYVLSAHRVVQ
ncbi:hypothetical protein HYFRA_00002332 [Hymenoscyphus fraxineus]|uniref:Uncharacterized protein n=1 Tax=Hymenoscyphus fraxineus TaxID=746836 RepID=A0A9N9LAR8_9HELO|nr:hypothetical protein HYFRA_00002332 [Hymenoscyphus fraxineus]